MAPLIDYLASPPIFLSLALLLFFLARGSRWPWTTAGGMALFTLFAGVFVFGLTDEGFRSLILQPNRLPIVVTAWSTAAVLWWEMHRIRRLASHPESTDPIDLTSNWLRDSDLIAATVVGLTIVLAASLIQAPLGAPADPTARPLLTQPPWFLTGWQEVGLYFDPWWSHGALPLLVFGGLLLLPSVRTTGAAGPGRRRALFLFVALFLWLWPIMTGGLLRGPDVLADAAVLAQTVPPETLAETLWVRSLHMLEPAHWWLRELPGFFVLFCYLHLLPRQLTRWSATQGVFLRYREAMGTWRFYVAVLWILALGLVPLKMISRWLFDISYWIYLPELGLRF